MSILHFSIYFCGMCDETFTEQIMIWKPYSSITKTYTVEDLNENAIVKVSDLINQMKSNVMVEESLGDWGMDNFSYLTTYVKYQDYLLGFKEDKAVSEILKYLNTDQLDFAYFIVGGASLYNDKDYRFTVHSDEKVHLYMPHVHVWKNDVVIRYSLDTLSPIDRLVYPHKRDHKKSIMPFLTMNKDRLLDMWQKNIDGYKTPVITEDGSQFYSES